jgi:hypothetical protein
LLSEALSSSICTTKQVLSKITQGKTYRMAPYRAMVDLL